MDWDKLRVFHAVAEAGSFTHAGERLNLSQSAISRQISALEESINVPLFHRHARGLILTEQGDLLYRTAHEVFAKLSMAEARIRESKETASGPLKVTTTVAFGSTWLTPRVSEFLDLFPDIQLSMVLAEGELDLGMREADVAIRMAPPRQSDLVQRQLMTLRYHVFAAPKYLQSHGTPQTPQDLAKHNLIIYGEDTHPPVTNVNWLVKEAEKFGEHIQPVLKLNNIYGMYRATQSGLGLAALPNYMVDSASGLVQVLPELEGPSFDAYFVYPEELRHSKRISAFRDFLIDKINELKHRNRQAGSRSGP